MAQGYDTVSWHRVATLCHGTELQHCVKTQRYDILPRQSYYIVSWHSVTTLCHGTVTTLCHGTELRHCVKGQRYIVMAQGYDIVSKRSVTTTLLPLWAFVACYRVRRG